MKARMKAIWAAGAAALLAGCFSVSRTEMPRVEFGKVPVERDVKVNVSGFAATITEYIPVYGYETAYVGGGRRRGGGFYQTVRTEAHLPQVRPNEAFLQRAQAIFEENGFLLRAATAPEWSVEVTFSGPYSGTNERTKQFCWMLGTLFTTEYAVQTWDAKLRVYDMKTGRVALAKEFSQKFEDYAFSPLPLIGLTGYEENTYNYMQSWCLTALTDRACAEATAFLAKAVK